MKADYQLRHRLFGRTGSLWVRQADAPTRQIARGIVDMAGNAPELTTLDQIAAGTVDVHQVLEEDATFHFVDGHFAVVGLHQRDYDHFEAVTDAGEGYYKAYHPVAQAEDDVPLPTTLALLSDDFLHKINADQGSLATGGDWYLIPVPKSLKPIVIASKVPDEYLVSGIDFESHDGYIALRHSPAQTLPSGIVSVPSAYRDISASNSFTLAAPSDRRSGKYLAEYSYRSQSLTTFRRAAAEYAGLYVFSEPDAVLGVRQIDTDEYVYTMASAGSVHINYPHAPLTLSQEIPPGYVVSGKFAVAVADHAGNVLDPKIIAAEGFAGELDLNGVIPVNGLTWTIGTPVRLDWEHRDPISGKVHARPHFGGDIGTQERYWEMLRLHELHGSLVCGSSFLIDILGITESQLPQTIDFWDLINAFYGARVILVLADAHRPDIDTRLRDFVYDRHPASVVVLSCINSTVPDSTYIDSDGQPVIDEHGEYMVDTKEVCVPIELDGVPIALGGWHLSLCPTDADDICGIISIDDGLLSMDGWYVSLCDPVCTPVSLGGLTITLCGAELGVCPPE